MEYVFNKTGKTKIIEKKQFKLEKYWHCYASVWPEYNVTLWCPVYGQLLMMKMVTYSSMLKKSAI